MHGSAITKGISPSFPLEVNNILNVVVGSGTRAQRTCSELRRGLNMRRKMLRGIPPRLMYTMGDRIADLIRMTLGYTF